MKAEVTAGSVTNLVQIAKLESDVGFSQGDAVADAVAGTGRFPRPLPLAILGKMYPNVVHLVTLGNAQIKQVSDLKNKRVSVGPPGSGNAVTAWNILGALGITEDDFEVRQLNYTETSNGIKDGTIDAGFIAGGIGLFSGTLAIPYRSMTVALVGLVFLGGHGFFHVVEMTVHPMSFSATLRDLAMIVAPALIFAFWLARAGRPDHLGDET